MDFNNFLELVKKINQDLGLFCNEFQYKRKELTGASRTAGNNELFGNIKDEEGWAINKGGGVEIQYHLTFNEDDREIKYGLGFNTQYVPFATNTNSPVELLAPYMNAFLELEPEINTHLKDYGFIHGSREQLIDPQFGQYTLFGKSMPVIENGSDFTISDADYNNMLEDFKKQFPIYIKIFELRNILINMIAKFEKYAALFKVKPQIILQGPPGTGKTYTAKEIAKEIVESAEPGLITNEDIMELIIPGISIHTPTIYNTFKIVEVKGNSIKIEPKGSTNTYNVPFAQVLQCYQNKDWDNPAKVASSSGQATYILGIAKYIFQEKNKSKIKLIQFHPAYSYEDFVRGITANPKGDFVEYKSEDKILGKFAAEALKNYLDSRKTADTLSQEQWLDQMFDDYRDSIQDTLDKEGRYEIPGAAHIFEVDETAFRYTGDKWGTKFRMPFSDLLKLHRLGIKERKQIKNNSEISGRAKQHATYYFNLLQNFRQFLSDKVYTASSDNKVLEQKFVLIIDEINRANLPAVLGELIYALEYRGEIVESMYDIEGDNSLILPPNLYIIGTMNTADRSVGHIDYAIRRRFAFVNIEPSATVISDVVPAENGLRDKALKLFANVASFFTNERMASDFKAKDIQLGHSYFLAKTENELSLKLEFEIKPLLKEYIKDGILLSIKNDKGEDLTEQEIDNLKIG